MCGYDAVFSVAIPIGYAAANFAHPQGSKGCHTTCTCIPHSEFSILPDEPKGDAARPPIFGSDARWTHAPDEGDRGVAAPSGADASATGCGLPRRIAADA